MILNFHITECSPSSAKYLKKSNKDCNIFFLNQPDRSMIRKRARIAKKKKLNVKY